MKAMLASAEMPKVIKFPIFASPKIDGVRGRLNHGVMMSRSWKPIPNRRIQDFFRAHEFLHGLDGELAVGSETHPNLMQITTSGVMSESGEPDFKWWVFDYFTHPEHEFQMRYKNICNFIDAERNRISPRIQVLAHVVINSMAELNAYEAQCLQDGYEGVICRSPTGPYKFNRSTAREQYMFKVKRFKDSEARITGYKEEMYNGNEATINEVGNTQRSSHKDNKVGKGALGALIGIDIHTDQEVSIGSGFTAEQRATLWGARDTLRDKIVKYKFFDHGIKEAPRHPVFLGFRDERDL